jgi:hypothetical protein
MIKVRVGTIRGLALVPVVTGIVTIAGAVACAQANETSPVSADGATTAAPALSTSACPHLDSRLLQLAQSSDPAALAASAGLDFRDGTVRAVIQLADASFSPAAYGLSVEGQYADLLQVRIAPSQLCLVSNDPAVAFVRPPLSAAPQGQQLLIESGRPNGGHE